MKKLWALIWLSIGGGVLFAHTQNQIIEQASIRQVMDIREAKLQAYKLSLVATQIAKYTPTQTPTIKGAKATPTNTPTATATATPGKADAIIK